jgi:hypothetical protein
LLQRSVKCVLELGDRNIEKSDADFRRDAQQNSKNKAVPRPWVQPKEAEKLSGNPLHLVGCICGVRSSPKRGPDSLNQKTPMGSVFTSANSVQHCGFSSRGVAPEKKGDPKS